MVVKIIQIKIADIGGVKDPDFGIGIVSKDDVLIGAIIFDYRVISWLIRLDIIRLRDDRFDIVSYRFEIEKLGLGNKELCFGGAFNKAFVMLFKTCFKINRFTDIKRFFVFVFENIDTGY